MTTIGEKTGTLVDVVDDIATDLASLADWSDADTSIVNDGSTDEWRDNGRVFKNDNTGTFLLFYIANGDVRDVVGGTVSGIRFITSSDWDTLDSHPAGYTNIIGDELGSQWDPHKHWNRRESFNITDWGRAEHPGQDTDRWSDSANNRGDRRAGIGAWAVGTSPGMDNLRTRAITYFASVANGRVQLMVWDNEDATHGIAGAFSWEHVGEKFWDDGVTPYAMVSRASRWDTANIGTAQAIYGFKSYANTRGDDGEFQRAVQTRGSVGCDRGLVSPGRWGRLNPDGTDDTFFFRRPVIYSQYNVTHRNRPALDYLPRAWNPVALLNEAIPNLPGEGASHGDIITDDDAQDYRVGVQSGAGRSNPIGIGLRFE
jgi:hypothetical protein